MSKQKMRMTLYADDLRAEDCVHIVPNKRVRAVLMHDDKIVLLRLENIDLSVLPGGGVHGGETLHAALKREVKEETGYDITDVEETFELTEYYPAEAWQHTFFRARTAGEPDAAVLTEEEKAFGLVPYLATFEDAAACFMDTRSTHPFAENIARREFLGLIHSYKDPCAKRHIK